MQRALFSSLAVTIAILLGWSLNSPSKAQNTGRGLAGARVTILAENFPTLQAALDALPAEGGLVRLPAGVFEIDKPLRVEKEDVCIEGAGTATLIKNLNESSLPALLLSDPDCKNPKTDRKHSLWRIRLSNFRVTGNPRSGAGIEARQIDEIFVQGVTVSENGGAGIRLDYCYEDPRIADCLITYNKGAGINLQGCHDIVVSACQFEENQDALHCFDGFNLCMTGCCVDDHLGNGVVIENTYGSVVSGNMIEECNGTAIVLDRDCYGITLSANVIAHNGGGIDLRDAHGCAVSANTFTILKTNAVRIGPDSGRITVSANNFSNSYIGDGQVRRGTNDFAAAGLVIDGANSIAISGNVFSGLTNKALTVKDEPTGVIFANNVLTDVTSDHTEIERGLVVDNLDGQP